MFFRREGRQKKRSEERMKRGRAHLLFPSHRLFDGKKKEEGKKKKKKRETEKEF